MKFGDNLKIIRKSKNISQEDLAENLGVSRQSVSKWETGENYPSMQNIVYLCTIFKCKMNDLVHEDFEDLDFLGEEVKMSVVKLNQKEQKNIKTLSKILSVIGKIGKVVARVAIVFVIIAMVMFPIIFSRLEVRDSKLVYNNSALNIKDYGDKVDIVLNEKDNVKIASIEKEAIDNITDIASSKNKALTITLFEIGMLALAVTIYLISMVCDYLSKLFNNIHNGDTPFTLDNVSYIKKMSYLMIACILLSMFGQTFINLSTLGNIDMDFNIFNILEIIFLYSMSLIFEYGYRIQQDSKGKMYGEE